VVVAGVGQDRSATEAAAKKIGALVGRGLQLRMYPFVNKLRFIKSPIALH
jgi:hypothetical protein